MKSLTYIELDIPYCGLVFGTAPCTASIPTTGAIKCFNSIKTCQDRVNFDETEVTLRFAKPTEYLPSEIDAIPSILDISFTPATISLGENLGTRATLTVQFKDHPHSDTGEGFDKYLADRDYDPFKQGSFWGKFRARQPFLFGRSIRRITGLLGQSLEEMETRHYVIDSFDGPSPDGKYTLIAKDILKLADGSKAQAPAMNSGFLVSGITSGSGSATLSPTGIGNAEYPASGTAVIAGKEIVTFTRSGDVLTLTARGQLNTVAASANAQDRVQVVLSYVAADPADIIYDLMVNYADIQASYINLADWQAETGTFLARLYSTDICEPTSVATLISELIQQACLCIWWDDAAQQIRLKVLRGIVTDAARFTPENTLKGSLTIKEQPEKRLSQVWTYFGRINPTKNLSDTDNYRSTSIVIDEESEEDYGSPVIKKIYSRWIPPLGRTVADRLGAILLGRFRDPPRRISFDTQRYAGTDIQLGAGYRVASKCFQDDTGALVDVPVQVTRLNPPADRFKGEAEEVSFIIPDDDLGLRTIVIDSNSFNINLRSAHDAIYPPPNSGDAIECRILAGVKVGSTAPGSAAGLNPAFDVGAWPSDVTVKIIVEGSIQGHGGLGGAGTYGGVSSPTAGTPGGAALYTRKAITLEFPAGAQLWGGGGGGGGGGTFRAGDGGGGGGGAGLNPGYGGSGNYVYGGNGTELAGGAGGAPGPDGYPGGAGGAPGLAGFFGPAGGLGGAAGAAIDGISFVTTTVTGGDGRGPTVN